jgi:hypothetical protein
LLTCAPFPTTGFILSLVSIVSPFVELVYKINFTVRDIRFPKIGIFYIAPMF